MKTQQPASTFSSRLVAVATLFTAMCLSGFEVVNVGELPPVWRNTVEDSSFEGAKWRLEKGAERIEPGRTGESAVRIRRKTEKEDPRCVGKAAGVSQGMWLLSGWFRSNATVGADRNFSAEVNVAWLDSAGKKLGRSRGLYINGVHPVWEYQQTDVVAPAGSASAEITFRFTGPIVGTCELDDLVLSQGGSGDATHPEAAVQVKLSPKQSIFDPREQPVVRVELRSARKQELPVRCQVEVFDSLGTLLGRGTASGTVPKTWRNIVEVPIRGLREGETSSFLPVGEWLEARATVLHSQGNRDREVGADRCGLLVWPRPTDYSLRPDSRFAFLVGHPYTKRWLGARWERPNLCNERRLELAGRYGVTCMPMCPVPLDRIDEPGVAEELEKKVEDYVRRHAPFLAYLQVGNEPPIFRPGVARQYVKCLRIAATAARRAKPGIKIAAAGITGLNVDEDMVAKMLDAGAAPYCDLIDIHTYLPLKTMDRLIGKVKGQMRERGVDKPLIITEVTANLGSPLPEREKASHVVQRHAIAFAHGIAQFYWFVMHGISPAPGHWDYCGVINIHNRAPWPAAAVYARLARELEGVPFLERERRGSGWSFTFDDRREKVFIAWSDDDKGLLALRGASGPVRIYDINAREYALNAGPSFVVSLTREPLIIITPGSARAELVAETEALRPCVSTVARGGGTLDVQVQTAALAPYVSSQPFSLRPILPRGLRVGIRSGDVQLAVEPGTPLGLVVPSFVQQVGGLDTAFLRLSLTVTEPFAVALRPIPEEAGTGQVDLIVRNLSSQPLSGTAEVRSPITSGPRPACHRVSFTDLAPESVETYRLSLSGVADPLASLPFELTVTTDSGATAAWQRDLVFTPAHHFGTAVKVDGDLTEWSQWPIVINGISGARRDPEGSDGDDPNDISARAAMQWDSKFLYIAVRITDDVHHNEQQDGTLWDGDSIQLGITSEPGVQSAPHCEYTIGLGSGGVQAWATRNFTGKVTGPVKFPVAVVRRDVHTCYELAIPWRELPGLKPEAGTWLGFGLVLNEDDGGGRGWLGWHHGIATDKSPALYGQATLVK